MPPTRAGDVLLLQGTGRGLRSIGDFLRIGLPLNALLLIVTVAILPLFFPF